MIVKVTLEGANHPVNTVLLHLVDILQPWRPELSSIADADDRSETRTAILHLTVPPPQEES